MPINLYEPPKEGLCDTCRQNVAVRHLRDDDLTERHLCVSCPYPITDWQLCELTYYLLKTGKCERCGGKPFSFGGLPGVAFPPRRLLCEACALSEYSEPGGE